MQVLCVDLLVYVVGPEVYCKLGSISLLFFQFMISVSCLLFLNNLAYSVSISSWNRYAFSVIENSGSAYAWGASSYGGQVGAAAVDLVSEVQNIYSTQYAFAALKANGSVVTWGSSGSGGDSSGVYFASVSAGEWRSTVDNPLPMVRSCVRRSRHEQILDYD